MSKIFNLAIGTAAVVSALAASAGAVWAAEEEKPKFTYSFNVGITSDYVFRGYSQKAGDPALQGGIDLSYAVLDNVTAYFGVWSSGVDFGRNPDQSRIAGAEVDIYGGIKPVWGPANFDLGVIWYTYPGSRDAGVVFFQPEQENYVELKAGVSGVFIPSLDKLTLGATVYYSPDYQAGQGQVVTVEGTAAYELPKVWVFTPTVSGTLGGQFGSDARRAFGPTGIFNFGPDKGFTLGNGEDSLVYWNAGISLALEKFTFDFRYWGNNVKNDNLAGGGANGWCDGSGGNGVGRGFLQCDDRYVFTAKYTY